MMLDEPILPIEATIALRSETVHAVGRDRIRLLQAVARTGSITAAAKAVGLTYKAAWDALDAMQNLFGRPLLQTKTGGRSGGGSQLTPAGLQAIEAFGRLEAEMARVLSALQPTLQGTGVSPGELMAGYFMKTSARNALRGKILEIRQDALTCEATVSVSRDASVYALVTAQSAQDLGLCVGRTVIVLVKAPFVMLAAGDAPPLLSARNCIRGTVARCETTPVSAEVVLDIGDGKTLAASVTAQGLKLLGLAPGKPAWAVFDAAHVILAID